MDASKDSVLRERLREVLGREPARVLSFTLTGGCLRREVFRGQMEVERSIEMVSQDVREGEEELEWIRFQKVEALKKAERMADLERKKVLQLKANKLRLQELEAKKEGLGGLVAECGGNYGIDMTWRCSCEELCQCLKSLEAVFITPEGGERRAVLNSESILGDWEVKNSVAVAGGEDEGCQAVVAAGGEVAGDVVGGEEGEAVITAEGMVTGNATGGEAESSDWANSEPGTHRGDEEGDKIYISKAIFKAQDVREKNKRLQEAEVEVARLRCEADEAMSMEAKELVVTVAERQVVNIVHSMEKLVGEKCYEEVLAEEAKLWKACGDILRALGPGARLKDWVYVKKFAGRLMYGQAAVMLGKLDLLQKVVGSKERPLRHVPVLGARGLDEHMMSRWFILRGIARVEQGRFQEGNWDFGRAEEVARKNTKNMGWLGKRVRKECGLLREWMKKKVAQKDGDKVVVEFPAMHW